MHILCLTHPTAEPDGKDTLFFTQSELPQLAKELVGAPALLEHDEKVQVGTVVDAMIRSSNLFTTLFLDENTGAGRLAAECVRNRITPECSLGHVVSIQTSANGKTKVVNKRGVEVSLVVKGARPNTKIIASIEDRVVKSSGNGNGLLSIQMELQRQQSELQMKIEQKDKLIQNYVGGILDSCKHKVARYLVV